MWALWKLSVMNSFQTAQPGCIHIIGIAPMPNKPGGAQTGWLNKLGCMYTDHQQGEWMNYWYQYTTKSNCWTEKLNKLWDNKGVGKGGPWWGVSGNYWEGRSFKDCRRGPGCWDANCAVEGNIRVVRLVPGYYFLWLANLKTEALIVRDTV